MYNVRSNNNSRYYNGAWKGCQGASTKEEGASCAKGRKVTIGVTVVNSNK